MEFWIKDMETDGEIRGKAFVHWKAWQEAYTGFVSQRYLDEHTLENSLDRAFRAADRCLVAGNGAGVIGFTSFGPARGEGGDTAGSAGRVSPFPPPPDPKKAPRPGWRCRCRPAVPSGASASRHSRPPAPRLPRRRRTWPAG